MKPRFTVKRLLLTTFFCAAFFGCLKLLLSFDAPVPLVLLEFALILSFAAVLYSLFGRPWVEGEVIVAIALLSIPVFWIAVLGVWLAIVGLQSDQEVTRYVRDHQQILDLVRSDPCVHEVSLVLGARSGQPLEITIDVDSKAAFDRVESHFSDIYELRNPAQWHITVRSGQRLGNKFGFGMDLYAAASRCVIAFVVAILLSVSLFGGFYYLRNSRLVAADYSRG